MGRQEMSGGLSDRWKEADSLGSCLKEVWTKERTVGAQLTKKPKCGRTRLLARISAANAA
jgi:hypothetical protein